MRDKESSVASQVPPERLAERVIEETRRLERAARSTTASLHALRRAAHVKRSRHTGSKAPAAKVKAHARAKRKATKR